ncbi:hypothetical protein PV10_02992 [Exophiala mesophila]|uniref:Zn(2)-C6 fungal-type domain-containing protein n=1 Tax=Exophiala mesophila TaxID=212818 RepID=A0A0D1ZKZ9_EXOME|nr:uncharacterized protein PV10_02992 [Exophiala mesophila]KIV95322.1 hypothetical protein PV10_02992 [Exophiala mesophila]
MAAKQPKEEAKVAENPNKRTRKAHNKVRSGCLTCKIRRKKCDEVKPFCRRCTSTGRKCDGYPNFTPPETSVSGTRDLETPSNSKSNDKVVLLSRPKSQFLSGKDLETLWRAPSSVHFNDDVDFYCFDFFRTRTGPEFASYFDSSIWRSYAVRACFQHPTVLAAAAAVGAAHRRFELGISREAFEFCEISKRMYQKAVKRLNDDLASNAPMAVEINMLSKKLFSIFNTFQGNYREALQNMTEAIRGLVNQNLRTTFSETQYRAIEISYDSLRRFFLKFELESVRLFNGPFKIICNPEDVEPSVIRGSDEPTYLPSPKSPITNDVVDPEPYPIPRAFSSLAQARDVLFTEAKWIWHTWGLMEQGLLSDGFQRHQAHISRLLRWSTAYAEFTKIEIEARDSQAKHAAYLLKIYREATYLLLLTQMALHEPDTGAAIIPLCDPPETCQCHRSCRTYAERKEALNAHFARLLVLAEAVFNASSFFAYDEHSTSHDSGIGPPIYLGTSDCRSTKVRHQVNNLLDKSEMQKRLWDTLGVYNIAEKLSSISEHAVVNAGIVPASLEPKWVDITFFLEDRRVLLRYCTPDRDGAGGKIRGTRMTAGEFGQGGGSGGLMWTQQWISYV